MYECLATQLHVLVSIGLKRSLLISDIPVWQSPVQFKNDAIKAFLFFDLHPQEITAARILTQDHLRCPDIQPSFCVDLSLALSIRLRLGGHHAQHQ